jgi:hypothetical protein
VLSQITPDLNKKKGAGLVTQAPFPKPRYPRHTDRCPLFNKHSGSWGRCEAQTFFILSLDICLSVSYLDMITTNKGEKHMKYLVMVSDLVARQVYVDASSREEALDNANYGKWRLPEDVAHEEVVDRQAVEILEDEGEDK